MRFDSCDSDSFSQILPIVPVLIFVPDCDVMHADVWLRQQFVLFGMATSAILIDFVYAVFLLLDIFRKLNIYVGRHLVILFYFVICEL